MKQNTEIQDWDIVVKPKASALAFGFKEVWKYRDLILLFVKRDWTSTYKQTILGPLWYFIQPIFTILIYFLLYGMVAKIPVSDGIPRPVYYMGGIVIWNYFVECLNITSGVFINNAHLFGKVYFPRLIVPISSVISSMLKFGIQLLLFLGIWGYYKFTGQAPRLQVGTTLLYLPILIAEVALLGMSFGLIISAFTTKYRDLRNIIAYVIQLGLFTTPIIYSLIWMQGTFNWFYRLCLLNPMTGIIETFKACFWPSETLNVFLILYPLGFLGLVFFLAIATFNKVEKTFLDSV